MDQLSYFGVVVHVVQYINLIYTTVQLKQIN